jgi:hypothetical protein
VSDDAAGRRPTADVTLASAEQQRKRQRRLLSFFLESLQEINDKVDKFERGSSVAHNRDLIEDSASQDAA